MFHLESSTASFRKGRKSGLLQLIESRRTAEHKFQRNLNEHTKNKISQQKIALEMRNKNIVEARKAKEIYYQNVEQKKEICRIRHEKMRELYRKEVLEYQQEIRSNTFTNEQRKKIILNRAKEFQTSQMLCRKKINRNTVSRERVVGQDQDLNDLNEVQLRQTRDQQVFRKERVHEREECLRNAVLALENKSLIQKLQRECEEEEHKMKFSHELKTNLIHQINDNFLRRQEEKEKEKKEYAKYADYNKDFLESERNNTKQYQERVKKEFDEANKLQRSIKAKLSNEEAELDKAYVAIEALKNQEASELETQHLLKIRLFSSDHGQAANRRIGQRTFERSACEQHCKLSKKDLQRKQLEDAQKHQLQEVATQVEEEKKLIEKEFKEKEEIKNAMRRDNKICLEQEHHRSECNCASICIYSIDELMYIHINVRSKKEYV